jgi:hypothetical protein
MVRMTANAAAFGITATVERRERGAAANTRLRRLAGEDGVRAFGGPAAAHLRGHPTGFHVGVHGSDWRFSMTERAAK